MSRVKTMKKKEEYKDEAASLVSNHILAYLESHPLINVRGLEKEIGAPFDTIRKAKESNGSRDIPEKYFYQIGLVLSNYGFDWPEAEDEKLSIFGYEPVKSDHQFL